MSGGTAGQRCYPGWYSSDADQAACPEKLDEVLLAGAFGSYINKKSALGIGLLPPVDPARIRAVGNAAGAGAIMALLSVEIRTQAGEVAAGAEHLELSARRDFQEEFLEALYF